jgi:Alternate to MurJ
LIPAQIASNVYAAGGLLAFMSVVDTLAYAVRTSGVKVKRLAISLAFFNILTSLARTSNLLQAPALGNIVDKVNKGLCSPEDMLSGFRVVLGFVAIGVVVGALLTPTFIRVACRGVAVLEAKGTLPRTILHGLRRIWRLPHYLHFPSLAVVRRYLDPSRIPLSFLVFNVFVTCFYTIGVMSTLLAATLVPELAVTCIQMSGIVNGMATMLLLFIVDPPGAVLIDQCIHGKRPASDSVTMNIFLILTRLCGVLLALVLLPFMARYVLWAAHLVDKVL